MDLNSLKDQVSNITLYDLKAGFRKAQNGTLQTLCPPANTNTLRSGDELHGDGGKGARGNQQRTMG